MQNRKKERFSSSESSTKLKRCRTFYKRDVEQQLGPASQNPVYSPRRNQNPNHEYRQLTEQDNMSSHRRHFYRRQHHDVSGHIRPSRSAASTFENLSTSSRKARDGFRLPISRVSSSAALPFARPAGQMLNRRHPTRHEASSVSNQSKQRNSEQYSKLSINNVYPVSADIDEGPIWSQPAKNEAQEQILNSRMGKPALPNVQSFLDPGLKYFSKNKNEMKVNKLSVDNQDHYPNCIQTENVERKPCKSQHHTQQPTQFLNPLCGINMLAEDTNSETANISPQNESSVEPGALCATIQPGIRTEEPTMEYLNHLLVEKYNLEQITSRAEISFDEIRTQSANNNQQRDGASSKAEFGGGDGAHIDPTMVTPIFYHLARLLDLEIERIRAVVFQLSPTEPAITCDAIQIASTDADVLEEELGVLRSDDVEELEKGHQESKISSKMNVAGKHTFLVTKRIEIDVSQSINNFNFVGRILGPRGATVKQLEQQTGCKILVRGGEARKSQTGINSNLGHGSIEPLHIIVSAESSDEIRSHLRVNRASRRIRRLLTPPPDGMDDLKKRQLIELAILNGTYRIPIHLLQHATETYEKFLHRNKISTEGENTNHSICNLAAAEATNTNVSNDYENRSKDTMTFPCKKLIPLDNIFSVGECASSSNDKLVLLSNVISVSKCTDSVPPECSFKVLSNHVNPEPEKLMCENENEDCSRAASSLGSTNDLHHAAINDLYEKSYSQNTQAIHPNCNYLEFSNQQKLKTDESQSQLWTTTFPSWPLTNARTVVNNAQCFGSYSNSSHPVFQNQTQNNQLISPMTYNTNMEPIAAPQDTPYIAIPFPVSLNCVPVYPLVSSTINGFGTIGFGSPPPRHQNPTLVPSIIFVNHPQTQHNLLSASPENIRYDPNPTTIMHDISKELPTIKYSDNINVHPSLSVSTFQTSGQVTHGSEGNFNTLKSQDSNGFIYVENGVNEPAYEADVSYEVDENKYFKKQDGRVHKWLESIEHQKCEAQPNKTFPITCLHPTQEVRRCKQDLTSRNSLFEVQNTNAMREECAGESESDEQPRETIVPDFRNLDSVQLQSYLFTNRPIRAEDLVSSINGKGDFEDYISERYSQESFPSRSLPNSTFGTGSSFKNNVQMLDFASNSTCPVPIQTKKLNNEELLPENRSTLSTMNYYGTSSDPKMVHVKNKKEFSHDDSLVAGKELKIRFPESSDDVRLQTNKRQISLSNSKNAQFSHSASAVKSSVKIQMKIQQYLSMEI